MPTQKIILLLSAVTIVLMSSALMLIHVFHVGRMDEVSNEVLLEFAAQLEVSEQRFKHQHEL